jgi:hypothetical protein
LLAWNRSPLFPPTSVSFGVLAPLSNLMVVAGQIDRPNIPKLQALTLLVRHAKDPAKVLRRASVSMPFMIVGQVADLLRREEWDMSLGPG